MLTKWVLSLIYHSFVLDFRRFQLNTTIVTYTINHSLIQKNNHLNELIRLQQIPFRTINNVLTTIYRRAVFVIMSIRSFVRGSTSLPVFRKQFFRNINVDASKFLKSLGDMFRYYIHSFVWSRLRQPTISFRTESPLALWKRTIIVNDVCNRFKS